MEAVLSCEKPVIKELARDTMVLESQMGTVGILAAPHLTFLVGVPQMYPTGILPVHSVCVNG